MGTIIYPTTYYQKPPDNKNRIKENTKGDKKTLVPLTGRAAEIVERRIRGRWNDNQLDEWLIPNPDTGRRYTVKKLREIFKTFSGLSIGHYEAGKHSSLTQISENEDAFVVRDIGRHSDIRTSQKYVHRRLERVREALNNRGKRRSTGRPRVEEKTR